MGIVGMGLCTAMGTIQYVGVSCSIEAHPHPFKYQLPEGLAYPNSQV